MRNFEYKELSTKLLTPAIVKQLLEIHEHKGRQEQYLAAPSKLLSFLLKIAVIQSTRSSNRIEGIVAADRRLKEIVKMDTAPVNRSESEIAGYRKALSLIHESYEYIEPKPGVILQLHRILYSFLTNEGGSWKTATISSKKRCAGYQPRSFYSRTSFPDTGNHGTDVSGPRICLG